MTQKLYSLVAGECCADNPDSPQLQEVLLPGHLYASIIKEKILDYLIAIKTQIKTDMRRQAHTVNFFDKKYLLKVLTKLGGAADIGKKLEYFLATGNLISNTGLDLQQVRMNLLRSLDFWIHYRCRKAQFLSIYLSFSLHSSWFILC